MPNLAWQEKATDAEAPYVESRQRKAPMNKAELPEAQVLKVLPSTITHR
jgi:hypothetical protein